MTNFRTVQMYECPGCGEYHYSERDAQTCCDISPETFYICEECDEKHKTIQDAATCCADECDIADKQMSFVTLPKNPAGF